MKLEADLSRETKEQPEGQGAQEETRCSKFRIYS